MARLLGTTFCLTSLLLLQIVVDHAVTNDELACREIVKEEGGEAMLPCSCPNPEFQTKSTHPTSTCENSISWFQEGRHIGDCNPNGVHINAPFVGYMNISSNGHLLNIYASNASHHGLFKCQIKVAESVHVFLQVEVPPRDPEITHFPERVTEGERNSLYCVIPRVRHTDQASVYWTTETQRNVKATVINETLNFDGTSRVTTRANVSFTRQDHEGTAACVTTWKGSDNTFDSTTQVLDVMFPPIFSKITVSPDGVTPEGKVLNCTCSANSSHPRSDIVWFLGEINVTDSARSGYLPGSFGGWVTTSRITSSLNREMNGENVQCRIFHNGEERTGLLREHVINMTFAPSVISMGQDPPGPRQEGFSVKFNCVTDSSIPVSTIEWYSNGQNLTHLAEETRQDGEYGGQCARAYLTIRALRENDRHNVTCVAIYKRSETVEDIRNIVTAYPHDVNVKAKLMASEGEPVNISCDAENGYPQHVDGYIWEFLPALGNVDPAVFNCEQKTCLLQHVQYYHAGTYKCEALNWRGALSNVGTAFLDVQHTAYVNMDTAVRDVYANKGDTVQLRAELYVFPPDIHVYCWDEDQGAIDESEIETTLIDKNEVCVTISIISVDYPRHRRITCRGKNSVGQSSNFTFQIHKPGPPEAPTNVQSQNTTAISVWVEFTPGLDGGSPQTFCLHYRKLQDPSQNFTKYHDCVTDLGIGKTAAIKLTPLDPDTAYYVMVVTENQLCSNCTGVSELIMVATKVAPIAENIAVSKDAGVLNINWTVSHGSQYVTQIIQECLGVLKTENLSCHSHVIEDGTTARLVLREDDGCSVHLLLEDRGDEVFRERVYQTDTHVNKLSCDSPVGWIAGFAVICCLLVINSAVSLYLTIRMCGKTRRAPNNNNGIHNPAMDRELEERQKQRESMIDGEQEELPRYSGNGSGVASEASSVHAEMNYESDPDDFTVRSHESSITTSRDRGSITFEEGVSPPNMAVQQPGSAPHQPVVAHTL